MERVYVVEYLKSGHTWMVVDIYNSEGAAEDHVEYLRSIGEHAMSYARPVLSVFTQRRD